MRTQKAVSAIAYHRPEVFAATTDSLRAAGVIGPCLWIAHKGEGEDKPHIHLVLLGGFKVYNTEGLSTLWGVDITESGAASVSALWRVTKSLNDWLLYAIHHPKYLISKGIKRECSYTWDDLKCSKGDEGVLREVVADAKDALETMGDRTTSRLIMLARSGYDWRRVVLSGLVPMGQLSQAAKAWGVIKQAEGKGGSDEGASDWA